MDLNSQSFTKSNRVESSLVLLDCINRIWTILKDKANVYSIANSINYYLKVAQFFQLNITTPDPSPIPIPTPNPTPNQQSATSITLTSKDLITNNFFKSISYILEFFAIKTVFKFMLYPNTLDNTTLILLEIEYENKPSQSETTMIKAFFKDISVKYLEALSSFLRENSVCLYEYQSILINCTLPKIWSCIVNNKHLGSAYTNGQMKLFDEIDKIGDKFTYCLQKEIHYAKVSICDRDNSKKWTFAFEVYNKEYTQLYCQISFFFLSISENMVFIAYNHDFKESSIDQITLNAISKRKKEFLNEIKKYLEK